MADPLFSTPVVKDKGTVRKFDDLSQSPISPPSESKAPPLKMRPLQVISPEEKRIQIENIVHSVVNSQIIQLKSELEAKLTDDFKDQINSLKSELQLSNTMVSELKASTDILMKKNIFLETTIKRMQTDLDSAKDRVTRNEYYSRKHNIRINGLKEDRNENNFDLKRKVLYNLSLAGVTSWPQKCKPR